MKNLEIIFHLNGTGVYYNPGEPIHLDALMAWVEIPKFVELDNIQKSDKPFDVPLPLEKWEINGQWVWKASALFPGKVPFESIQYWRKKFRMNKIEIMEGSVNTKQGRFREYNTPMCLILTPFLKGWCVGNKNKVKKILSKIKYLGKKTAYGKGKVTAIEIKEIDNDYSLWKDDKTTRWLPDKNGMKFVRCRPPYWNRIDRINCKEIEYNLL